MAVFGRAQLLLDAFAMSCAKNMDATATLLQRVWSHIGFEKPMSHHLSVHQKMHSSSIGTCAPILEGQILERRDVGGL